ncbi:hypothetical protein VNO80_24148 [Phaseolus coccineus]|uniref:Uncharacterized protein n=1 Tax=Phaseolus coccineus TaxID=3886 RepID=A0AAN9QMT1_PHACN
MAFQMREGTGSESAVAVSLVTLWTHKVADSSSPSLPCQEDKELHCSTKETHNKATHMAHRFEKHHHHHHQQSHAI